MARAKRLHPSPLTRKELLVSSFKFLANPGTRDPQPATGSPPKGVSLTTDTKLRSRLNYDSMQSSTHEGVAHAKESQGIERGAQVGH